MMIDKLSEHDNLNEETTSCSNSAWHSYSVWCDADFTGKSLILKTHPTYVTRSHQLIVLADAVL